MRYCLIVLIFALGFVSKSFSQSYGLGNTDPSVFSRFRVPDTHLRSILFGSNLSYSSDRYSAFSSGYSNSNNSFFSTLSPALFLRNETDDYFFHLNSTLNGSYRRASQESTGPPFSQNYYSKLKSFETDLRLLAVYRTYLSPGEVFYSLESDVSVQLIESRRDESFLNLSNLYRGEKRQSYTLTPGVGWGKMRNVTAVVSALRFQERLKQLNLIDNDLGDGTIEALAEQFYRQGYYGQVHVRPDKYFWQEVGNTISAEGVSLDGINQYGNSYLRETPGELRFERNEGVVGSIGIQLMYNNNYDSDSSPKIFEQFFALANLSVRYSHQLNLNSQAVADLSLSGGPNLMKNPAVRQYYTVSARLGYSYELTDRLVTIVDNEFTLSFSNARQQGRNLANTFRAAVSYFVEDQLSLTGSYRWNFIDTKYALSAGHDERIFNDVQVGLTYYVWRGFIQGAM